MIPILHTARRENGTNEVRINPASLFLHSLAYLCNSGIASCLRMTQFLEKSTLCAFFAGWLCSVMVTSSAE